MRVTRSVASLGMTRRPLSTRCMRHVICPLIIVNPCQLKLTLTQSINQALDRPDLSPRTRENCLKSLYKTCGRRALLPTVLKIPIPFERTGDALFRGGFADVWKGEHCGRDIAVKVVRIYSNSDLQRVAGVSFWLHSVHAYSCTDSARAEVLQGGCCMENPPASECPTTDRSDDVRDSVRNGIRLDGERKHQQLCEGTP